MIDLHAHTTASDGQYSPTQLVEQALAAGLRTLAVTDHDTLAGIEEASQAARGTRLELVPGIELSAFVDGKEAHLLGHFVSAQGTRLGELSQVLRAEREKRMHKMIARLQSLGLEVPFDEVVAVSGSRGKNLGRPHLARVMIQRGYVPSVQEAFDRFIGAGGPAYVERYKLTSAEAIALVREAGGVASLAHARVSGLSFTQIRQLKEQGLVGLEIDHSDHKQDDQRELLEVAHILDLVPTAGSDYHGETVAPGRKLGTVQMLPEDLERLRARCVHAPVAHEG